MREKRRKKKHLARDRGILTQTAGGVKITYVLFISIYVHFMSLSCTKPSLVRGKPLVLGKKVSKLRGRIPSSRLEILAEIGRATTPQLLRDLPDRLILGRQQALGLLHPPPSLVDIEGTPGKGEEVMRDIASGNPSLLA
jgi:hypothetical protein